MKHLDSRDWRWDPVLMALFDALGLTWKVLPEGEGLGKQLGSSPGDTIFTGRVFVFEHTCPQLFVVHELAHWLYCRQHRPKGTRLRNYGFENAVKNLGSHIAAASEESEVSYLTCGLEQHLGIGDVLESADEFSLYDGVVMGSASTYKELPPDAKAIRQLFGYINKVSAPILQTLPICG